MNLYATDSTVYSNVVPVVCKKGAYIKVKGAFVGIEVYIKVY